MESWQAAAGETGMAQDIKPVTMEGEHLVVLVEMGGTEHCFTVKVLRENPKPVLVWTSPASDDTCTGNCPALKAQATGETLTIEVPSASDPNDSRCKRLHWKRERFRWNGTTFMLVNE